MRARLHRSLCLFVIISKVFPLERRTKRANLCLRCPATTWLPLHQLYIMVAVGLFCQQSFGEGLVNFPQKIILFEIMPKAPGKSDGQTVAKILLEAMSKNNLHLAKFVLDAQDGEMVDSKAEGAQTLLVSSVLLPDGHSRCRFAELLLQRGASVNCQDASGRTALSYACEKGFLDAVKILVRNNADPEIVDCWGNTALMYAAVAGHSSTVEFLVRAFKRLGLQIHRQNKAGNSAVEVAKFLGHTECISALSNPTKMARETEGGSLGCARPRLHRGDVNTPERKVVQLVNKPEVLQRCIDKDRTQVFRLQPRYRMKQSRLPWMDSIDEFEREKDCCSSAIHELVFSGILTPDPPPRTSDHPPTSSRAQPLERLNTSHHLPPLTLRCEPQNNIPFPSQSNRSSPNPSAPSALGILLTPNLAHSRESESGPERSKMSDFCLRRFHDSYYKKRFSLPTSILSPSPPDRTLFKSRTVKRHEAPPCKVDAPRFRALDTHTSSTTISGLSNKLLRRFTSPEFKKDTKESEEDPVLASGRIPRSETFPQGFKHLKVASKPSIDSISSVKCVLALSVVLAEQEGENLSGLSNNPDKAIFAVRENGTTCLMVEFAVKFLVPYDVLALNGIDLITEQASFTLPRSAEIEGKCGSTESEIHISWKNTAYTLRIYFSKELRDKGAEVWKISKVQFVYDTSETSHFMNAYNPGKHTASTHHLSALVTPTGHSYVCTSQQTLTLISSDHQKGITVSMYDVQIQPFDIASDFMFSEPYKCITDQRERLEETLPLILGLILGLIIVIILTIYHFHLKLTATQPQLPRDRSMYKNM